MKGGKPQLHQDAGALGKVPSAPSWMSKDAKAEWRRIMPALVERRILTEADLGSVENYCVSIGRVREIERAMQASPTIVVGLFRMQNAAAITARQLAAELGLTPVSRSRPNVREASNDAADLSPLDI